MCVIEPSLDLALEQLINFLFVIINLLSIVQQVAGTELGTVENKSVSLRTCNLGRTTGMYVPKTCCATNQHEKWVSTRAGGRI